MIDLRSDTLTLPSPAMREAMHSAELGDDVYGEDPTVNELERYAAEITGKQAAVLMTSGTQSNLAALMSHCERGHEYIAGYSAHTFKYEAGGSSVLGGIQPYPIAFRDNGELPLDAVEAGIKPDDSHYAITRLVCLENTTDGKVLSLDYMKEYSAVCHRNNLRRHLDGARAFNAAVASGLSIGEIADNFDTVSLCLSKGLGTPMGSVLVGDSETISKARRWRKMLGGGLRQAGIIAAAGLYALKHNVERLQHDHDKASRVAQALKELPGFSLAWEPQSNMVWLHPDMEISGLISHLADAGVKINGHRWVFHMDVSDEGVERLLEACRSYASSAAA